MNAAAVELLTVRNLHAGYGKAEVLAGLSLRAAAGSVVTVIGPVYTVEDVVGVAPLVV